MLDGGPEFADGLQTVRDVPFSSELREADDGVRTRDPQLGKPNRAIDGKAQGAWRPPLPRLPSPFFPVFPRRSLPGVTTEACLERVSHPLALRLRVEEMGVGTEGDRGVGVAELASDEDDVGALVDQHRGEAVAEVMHSQLGLVGATQPRSGGCLVETALHHVPVQERRPGTGREDEVCIRRER
jgi:hypothetical protein